MSALTTRLTGLSTDQWVTLARSDGRVTFSDGDADNHDYNLVTIPGGFLNTNSVLEVRSCWSTNATAGGGNRSIFCQVDGTSLEGDYSGFPANSEFHLIHEMAMNGAMNSNTQVANQKFVKWSALPNNVQSQVMAIDMSTDSLVKFVYNLNDAANAGVEQYIDWWMVRYR